MTHPSKAMGSEHALLPSQAASALAQQVEGLGGGAWLVLTNRVGKAGELKRTAPSLSPGSAPSQTSP